MKARIVIIAFTVAPLSQISYTATMVAKRYLITSCLLACILVISSVSAIDVRPKGNRVTIPDEITADSALKTADSYFQDRNYDEASAAYTHAAEKARAEFNRSVETEALAQLARVNLTQDKMDEAASFLEQARERASDSDPMGWSRFLGVRGRLEWRQDDLQESRRTFDQMYEYCSSNALWSRAVDAAHMIAIVADSPEDQITWGRRGIKMAEKADVESWLGPLWNNLAGTYYDLKQFDSTLTCYLKAREYHWRNSGETAKLFADYHVGMAYRLVGRPDEAAKWLRPVLAWAERIENHSAMGQALQDLGEIAISKGDRKTGVDHLKRARDEYAKAGFDKSWPEVWESITERLSQLK